jgi:polygalacturonase
LTATITFLRAARFPGISVLAMLVLPVMALADGTTFDVRQYGATGDGTNLDTAALRQAIDGAAPCFFAWLLPERITGKVMSPCDWVKMPS